MRGSVAALVLIALVAASGCAARFSSDRIRREIVAQRGEQPRGMYEVSLGRFTTALLKRALSGPDGDVPFSGMRELEVAIFDTAASGGPALDTTLLAIDGWDPIVRIVDERRSAIVLVRGLTETSIGDLVVVASGREKVVYGRLRGVLDADLPAALGDAFREGGTERLQDVFNELADDDG